MYNFVERHIPVKRVGKAGWWRGDMLSRLMSVEVVAAVVLWWEAVWSWLGCSGSCWVVSAAALVDGRLRFDFDELEPSFCERPFCSCPRGTTWQCWHCCECITNQSHDSRQLHIISFRCPLTALCDRDAHCSPRFHSDRLSSSGDQFRFDLLTTLTLTAGALSDLTVVSHISSVSAAPPPIPPPPLFVHNHAGRQDAGVQRPVPR